MKMETSRLFLPQYSTLKKQEPTSASEDREDGITARLHRQSHFANKVFITSGGAVLGHLVFANVNAFHELLTWSKLPAVQSSSHHPTSSRPYQ